MPYFSRQNLLALMVLCLVALVAYFAVENYTKETARLLLEVDVVAFGKERVERLRQNVLNALNEQRVAIVGDITTTGLTVQVQIKEDSDFQAVRSKLNQLLRDTESGRRRLDVVVASERLVRITVADDSLTDEVHKLTTASVPVIQHRLREFGMRDELARRSGDQRIAIELPNGPDLERLVRILGRRGRLTLHLVDTSVTPEQASKDASGNFELLYGSPEQGCKPYVVRKDALISKSIQITDDFVADAQAAFDQSTKEHFVALRFNVVGALRLAQAMQDHKGNSLAIALDDEVLTVQAIEAPIVGGSVRISGNMTKDSAHDLAIVLRTHGTPAPLVKLDQHDVGLRPGLSTCRVRAASTGAVAR